MYRALIVCNSRFPESHGSLSDLHGPKRDGYLLRDVLTDHATGMFDKSEVRNLNEGDSGEVSLAIEQFFNAAEPDDTLLFYYSGHGQTRNQQLFLCTQNTDVGNLYTTGIPGIILNNLVETSLAEAKILILDCCYGAMFKGTEITEELSGTGRYVIAATSATQRASDGLLRGLPSPFTQALADALLSKAVDRNGDGQVDLDDVFDYLGSVRFDGSRPHRNFDGSGAVPVAFRAPAPAPAPAAPGIAPAPSPAPSTLASGLTPAQDSAIYALESAQSDLPYLDRTVAGARFSLDRVEAFRAQMRSDLLEEMPARIPAWEFLQRANLMRHDRLTYAGLLLFGENPSAFLPSAVVQCVRFHGTTMTAPLESSDLQGTVPELIVGARDFVARVARIGDMPTADGAYAQAAYRYPMIAVREIIANAVVHRDYADQESCVQIYAFDDRIEISSPGNWGGAPLPTMAGERPLGQLERRSQRRNFRLAFTLAWSKLVEGVGAGVPRSIADCESAGAPEPVVDTDERTVKITIFPAPPPQISEPSYSEARDSRKPLRAPLYQQIAEDIRLKIESGEIGPGEMLPTEIDLRETYNASRNTIRDAIKRLAALGLVETRPGQGTFVTRPVEPFVTTLTADPRSGFGGGPGYPEAVREAHRAPGVSLPKVEVRSAPEPIRLRLRLQEGETVVSRHQERYIDDVPWSLQTSFYPMSFVTDGATDLLMATNIAQGTVAYLAEHGHRQASYRDWITARRADENEQRFFRIGYEATVFEIFRTGYDQQGAPMRVTVSVFSADQNQFIYNVGDPPDPRDD